ncbi:MAG: carboxypeptidase regulatory-like domain-containing protein [Candidatus Omnitrophica bacterium]|nr:carboxypeptidase regulatory-like domain-containing protein [Candidatus Omnitrophota bacterium]
MKPKKQIFMVTTSILALVLVAWPVHGATIKGLSKYEGELPKLKPLTMSADPICESHHHGKEVLPEVLVLGANQELANVFVYVKSGLPAKDFPAPQGEVVITQEGCQYKPHVLGVRTGQTVKILNPDGTLHNVHGVSKKNPEFNLAMPKFRTEITKVFDQEEFMFPLKCDVHPWMGAWISVMKHPYFATTGTDGLYQIADLPAGTYEIEAWHERMGAQTQTVTLAEGETKEINFNFSKPSK